MDIEQALNRVVELAMKWQQSHEWAAAFKAADRFREYRAKGTERFDELSEEKHALVIAAHGEFVAMENLLRSHAPQFLELVPGVNFFTDAATDHSQQIRDLKKLEGAVRAMLTPVSETDQKKNVRKSYASGTQKKNSAKNNHAWDANAKRMATRYIAACKRDGKKLNRTDFIAEELACNADDFPNAREASTINQSLKIHSANWKPRLDKALGKTTDAE